MSYPILIVGETGTGKSSSFRNLPRESTSILNAELKPLPFRNSKFVLNGNVTSTAQLIKAMKSLEKNEKIKFCVLDSISMFAESCVFKEKVEGQDGFQGWTDYKQFLISVINQMKVSRINYIATALEKKEGDSGEPKTCCASLQGSLKGGSLESHYSMVFRSMKVDDIDSPTGVVYKFATNQIPGERITAKTPLGMFEDQYVDNDVVEIYKKIFDYYK